MKTLNVVISPTCPRQIDVLWLKPVGKFFAAYLLDGTEWKPLKTIGDVETTDITALEGSQLDLLNVGDQVVKKTGVQRHLYTVTYKGEGVGQGLCLTYADASVVETVSYDFTADGWVYNSTDTTPIIGG